LKEHLESWNVTQARINQVLNYLARSEERLVLQQKSRRPMTLPRQKSQDSKKDLNLIDARPWWGMIKKGARQVLALTQADQLLATLEQAAKKSKSPEIRKAIREAKELKEAIRKIK